MAKREDLKKSLNLPKRPISTNADDAEKIIENVHNSKPARQSSGPVKRSSIDWPYDTYVALKQLVVELDMTVKDYVRMVVEKDLQDRGRL